MRALGKKGAGVFCISSAIVASALASCAPSLAQREKDASAALGALSRSRFEEAGGEADRALSKDGGNPYAAAVSAIARYKATMHDLVSDVVTVFIGAAATGHFNDRYLTRSFEDAEKAFGGVDALLSVAASEPEFAMELCPACLAIDWNRNGEVDDFDERLLEVELDEREQPLPAGDPRRRPTFRFDHGDFLWARAFIAFHRAALDLALAYEWSDAAAAALRDAVEIRVRLAKPDRIAEAKRRILEGLELSDECREAYLAETDDDREWLPNPRQGSHPMPLPVDAALYETWKDIAEDARRLVRGEEGIDVGAIAQLGDHRWANPPRGFIDVGRLFDHPRDIVLRFDDDLFDLVNRGDDGAGGRAALERELAATFGDAYVKRMKPSRLTDHLERMKGDVERGTESIGRKLRYLVWIN